ncbi:hypothetical protein [Falsihalocynthiibacter sp. CO-5D18]|uniref:hypothetical protein n=1 Tax=Falsihalocynthiibacter sp. CO-5D18 TaxID=3240872 RepID=UPI0035100900
MHQDFISYGFCPTLFWEMTPREVVRCFDAARDRTRLQYEASLWQAWHAAYLARVKDFPEFSDLLRPRKKEPQDAAAQTLALNQLFLALGGKPADLEKMKKDQPDE